MDHVLSKQESEQFSEYIPEIPWLGYDHKPSQIGDFDDYALQRGWSREKLTELKEGRLANVDTNGLKPFLQSWFSIGLCEMSLGRGLEQGTFITTNKDFKNVYTSEPLDQIVKELQTEFLHRPKNDQEKTQVLERFIRVLASASVWCRMLGEPQVFIHRNPDFCDETYRETMRLFTLTGAALQYAAHHLTMFAEGNFRPHLQNQWKHTFENRQALNARLVDRGWCPYIQTTLTPFNVIVPEYAAIVGPPSTLFAHISCSGEGCVRHNIDESTYETMHAKPDCQCDFVRPSLSKIAEILDCGGIPLMNLSKVSKTEDGCSVEVVPFEEGKTTFTAVSHVWSGGLGSTSEKGLPECAIDFLAGYKEADAGSKLVWIDSLCIPSEKRLRKLSIQAINNVYSRASHTLILDPELMYSNSASTQRMLLWVTTAAWMQRMWTLPEGRLSQLPFIAFQDGVVPLPRLLRAEESTEYNPVTGALRPELRGLFSLDFNTLRYIHGSLCFRTTSKREDEAPALAALFGIDARRILETKSLDERMAIFWIALREKMSIPMNVLFLRGPKLPIPGLRWAPSSLLNAGHQLSLIMLGKDVTAYNVDLGNDGSLSATYVVISLERRSRILLDKVNSIMVAILLDPGSEKTTTGMCTIRPWGEVDPDDEGGVLEDIDAFVVNVTNIEAKTGASLADELVSSSKTVVALTLSDPQRSRNSFVARHWMQLVPLESKGNDLGIGYTGWLRISIS